MDLLTLIAEVDMGSSSGEFTYLDAWGVEKPWLASETLAVSLQLGATLDGHESGNANCLETSEVDAKMFHILERRTFLAHAKLSGEMSITVKKSIHGPGIDTASDESFFGMKCCCHISVPSLVMCSFSIMG